MEEAANSHRDSMANSLRELYDKHEKTVESLHSEMESLKKELQLEREKPHDQVPQTDKVTEEISERNEISPQQLDKDQTIHHLRAVTDQLLQKIESLESEKNQMSNDISLLRRTSDDQQRIAELEYYVKEKMGEISRLRDQIRQQEEESERKLEELQLQFSTATEDSLRNLHNERIQWKEKLDHEITSWKKLVSEMESRLSLHEKKVCE